MTELLQCLGTGFLGSGNDAANSWGQGLRFTLDTLEAGKGHREPRRLSKDVRRRISNRALQTVNTVMEELCIQNKQRQIKGGNQGKGKSAGRTKRLSRDV